MIKIGLKLLAIASPLIANGIYIQARHLHGASVTIGWIVAAIIACGLSHILFGRDRNSGPRLVVKGEGWPTWDFWQCDHGPKVPPGTYDVKIVLSPTTRRPTVVLDDPTDFGLSPTDLVGQDEENLRQAIAAGQAKMKLCV